MASSEAGRERSSGLSRFRQLVQQVIRGLNYLQAWTPEERTWRKCIKKWFPRRHKDVHFIPAIYFNRTPRSVASVAGEVVQVRDNPLPTRPRPRQAGNPPVQPPPPLPQVAGALYVANPPDLQPVHIQDSDRRDDEAQQRCLQALSQIHEGMIVMSQLTFRRYLEKQNNSQSPTNPLHAAASAQIPTIANSSLPQEICDGECDIIIIHCHHGLIVGELKSVGGDQHFSGLSAHQQNGIIVRKLTKAVDQLRKQQTALQHLVSDLSTIRITLTLFLPNITRAQLSAALNTSPGLTRDLCQTLSMNRDLAQAMDRCLCKEFLGNPSQLWGNLFGHGPGPSMTPVLYERLAARFCGPATTVDIPTACLPSRVVRTLGQAVAETGLRFASIALTPPQVGLLNRRPQYVYLQGPPGCGKTIVLFLAALESARRGSKVAIVHGPDDVAVATLLKEQLASSVGKTAATFIHLHPCNFEDNNLNVRTDVARLQQELGPGNVHIIVDEVPWRFAGRQFVPWVAEVGTRLPQALLWSAGLVIRDNNAPDPSWRLPQWVEVTTLCEPLRCPPQVTEEVARDVGINDVDIPRYLPPSLPVPTQGPDVRYLQHRGQDGHTGGDHGYLHCPRCADNVADILRELRVGQPGHPQHRDVWVLAGYFSPAPRAGDAFERRLRQAPNNFPVQTVERPVSAAGARELALAVSDTVIVTHQAAVQGLERSVVVVVGGRLGGVDFTAISRSTSFLCIIP